MNWKQAEWLCVDTETTGVGAEVDRIVELAAVRYHAGRVIERRGMLVNPERAIPQEASDVHGITDDDVAGAETMRTIGPRFLDYVRGAEVLVAYNWPFDDGMLEVALGDEWAAATADKPVIDPLVVVRFDDVGRFWRGKERHKLEAVATRLGIPLRNTHRAGSDALIACHVLWKLRGHLPDDGYEAAALIERERAKQDEQFQAWLAAQPPQASGAD